MIYKQVIISLVGSNGTLILTPAVFSVARKLTSNSLAMVYHEIVRISLQKRKLRLFNPLNHMMGISFDRIAPGFEFLNTYVYGDSFVHIIDI